MSFLSALNRHEQTLPLSRKTAYLYKSYPAANDEPRVGSLAFGESLFTRRLVKGTTEESASSTFLFLTCGAWSSMAGRGEETAAQHASLPIKRVAGSCQITPARSHAQHLNTFTTPLQMPEIPITAYFPPVPSNPRLHSQARQRPSPPKRARPVDVSEAGRHSSRKKTKTPNNDLKGKQREYAPPASRKARLGSHWSPTQPEEQGRRVIELEDTPPSSPVKPVLLRHATPPSSPLPELTPSPETELRYLPCRPPINPMTEVAGFRPSTSSEPASPYRCPLEFEVIPSSQTQTLDSLLDYETATPTCTLGIPLANTSLQSPEPTTAYPESALTSRSHFVPTDCNSELDDFIASSQSPHMSLPIDPELELVPSSQTQEFFHSQRTGLYSSQEDEPKPRCSDFGRSFSQF
jgi:hypothetical protein